MAMGQLNTPWGIFGRPQTSLARARARAGSRTVMPGSFLGSGLVCPSCVIVGSRVTRTDFTAAGFAHTGAGFIGAPAWLAGDEPSPDGPACAPVPDAGEPEAGEAGPPAFACPQPASAAIAMITEPIPAATGTGPRRFSRLAIPLGRLAPARGSVTPDST